MARWGLLLLLVGLAGSARADSQQDRNLALAALRSGQPDRAVTPLRRILRRAPTDAVAHRLMGRALAELGKLKPARRHLDKAVASSHALGPVVHATTLMVSGVVRARAGKLFGAMVDLTQARNLLKTGSHPKLLAQVQARLARVRAALGIEQLRQGKEQAAWRSLRGALTTAADLSPPLQAEIQRAVALGVAVRGKLQQAKKQVPGLKTDVGPVLQTPYAPMAAELMEAYADYFALDSRRRLKAGESFERLAGQVGSPANDKLVEMALRARLRAATLLFEEGAVVEAHRICKQILASTTNPSPACRHNLAVLDYATGNRAPALATLKKLKTRVPLAACNLAVHSEHAYIPWEAYQLFKECKARGGRFPGLEEILDAKRRAFKKKGGR